MAIAAGQAAQLRHFTGRNWCADVLLGPRQNEECVTYRCNHARATVFRVCQFLEFLDEKYHAKHIKFSPIVALSGFESRFWCNFAAVIFETPPFPCVGGNLLPLPRLFFPALCPPASSIHWYEQKGDSISEHDDSVLALSSWVQVFPDLGRPNSREVVQVLF